MGDLGTQEVLVRIIIHHDTQPEEHMNLKNMRVSQVCPLSYIRGGGLSWIFCKERLENSTHHHLMESIRMVKMFNPCC